MYDHNAAMIAFIKLAGLSQSKGQLLPTDKFLVLAGVAAHQAGCESVAQRCRALVLTHNPAHLLRRYESFAEAVNDEYFTAYFKQLTRFCSYEKAEHLLTQLQIAPGNPALHSRLNPGEYALLLLGRSDTPPAESQA